MTHRVRGGVGRRVALDLGELVSEGLQAVLGGLDGGLGGLDAGLALALRALEVALGVVHPTLQARARFPCARLLGLGRFDSRFEALLGLRVGVLHLLQLGLESLDRISALVGGLLGCRGILLGGGLAGRLGCDDLVEARGDVAAPLELRRALLHAGLKLRERGLCRVMRLLGGAHLADRVRALREEGPYGLKGPGVILRVARRLPASVLGLIGDARDGPGSVDDLKALGEGVGVIAEVLILLAGEEGGGEGRLLRRRLIV
ncbi:hypothetical protein [Collinsella vaginalis]|uniref:hypothetical protein n=1 Tax=Collinsella vaginalis TaxID=1870987 RepID=UPI000A26B5C9|nr:hypothetical protein [Collinsella vaginalis]